MSNTVTPDHIMQIGMGFWASKTLLSAVELDLFTSLCNDSLTTSEIEGRVGLHERASSDFLDSLVSLKLLDREGAGSAARYRNTEETATFLDRTSPLYAGGMLEMANSRLYGFWGSLTEALRTGRPQNEAKHGGDFLGPIYASLTALEGFLNAMKGLQLGNHHMLVEKVDLSGVNTFCDMGGANAALSILVAQRYPNLRAMTFDLPPVAPIAERQVKDAGLAERIEVRSGDFFIDQWPRADVIVLGNILHDWDEERKRELLSLAYGALNDGGRLMAIENVIDDDRRENTFGLLMSLNMLIEMEGGFDYTGAQFNDWCLEVGFRGTNIVPLAGPSSAAIAYK